MGGFSCQKLRPAKLFCLFVHFLFDELHLKLKRNKTLSITALCLGGLYVACKYTYFNAKAAAQVNKLQPTDIAMHVLVPQNILKVDDKTNSALFNVILVFLLLLVYICIIDSFMVRCYKL